MISYGENASPSFGVLSMLFTMPMEHALCMQSVVRYVVCVMDSHVCCNQCAQGSSISSGDNYMTIGRDYVDDPGGRMTMDTLNHGW